MGFPSLYSPPLLYVHHPHVDQITDLDTSPVNTFLKLLMVAIRPKIIVKVSLPH